MTTTVKEIDVRPSAGIGTAASDIPAALAHYCEILLRAPPTHGVATSNEEQDIAQAHLHAVAKGSLVDEGSFGLSVNWEPRGFHTVDPADPGVWDSSSNLRGVLYDVEMDDGSTAHFSVNIVV